MSFSVRLDSVEATRTLGAFVACQLLPGDVVLLSGGLGAGKTTMTQGLMAALGITAGVTSPTFALCHLYPSDPVVAHVDCWRLIDPQELVDLAIDEVLDDGGVAIIEWGERAAFLYGEIALNIVLAGNGDRRIATLASSADHWCGRLQLIGQECARLEEGR